MLEQQIRRFDVPMNDTVFEGMLQRRSNLLDDLDRAFHRDRTPPLDLLAQIDPLDIFHRDEQIPIRFARVVNRDNVGMLKLTCRLSFCLEPPDEYRVFGLIARQNLEGDQLL